MAIGFEYPVKGKLVLEVAPTETFTFSLASDPMSFLNVEVMTST